MEQTHLSMQENFVYGKSNFKILSSWFLEVQFEKINEC